MVRIFDVLGRPTTFVDSNKEKNKQQCASMETWSPNFSKALHWPSKYNNGEYESECWKPFSPNSIKRKKNPQRESFK